jgi:hypothetical protein
MLVQYIRWYKSIYEMMPNDRPSDDVIADDEALDRWFDKYTRDVAKRMGGTAQSQTHGSDLLGMDKENMIPMMGQNGETPFT